MWWYMNELEPRFSPEASMIWMDRYRMFSVYVGILYVVSVLAGRWYMRDKPAFGLRRVLVFWNTCLAVFSTIGVYTFIPPLVAYMREGGLGLTVCQTSIYTEPVLCLWLFLFVLSKMMELGDTVFIVLRKTPLTFLHCYHHFTVLLYCWCLYSTRSSIGHWFSCMNYGAHSVMYTYYAVKGSGYRVPLSISQCVTTLQMSQFFFGLGCNLYAVYLKANGYDCALGTNIALISFIMYGSYSVLFANFFYHRYIKKEKITLGM